MARLIQSIPKDTQLLIPHFGWVRKEVIRKPNEVSTPRVLVVGKIKRSLIVEYQPAVGRPQLFKLANKTENITFSKGIKEL